MRAIGLTHQCFFDNSANGPDIALKDDNANPV